MIGHDSFRIRIPTDWVEGKLRALGLDVYVQNYSFSYPERLLKGQVGASERLPFGMSRSYKDVLLKHV